VEAFCDRAVTGLKTFLNTQLVIILFGLIGGFGALLAGMFYACSITVPAAMFYFHFLAFPR